MEGNNIKNKKKDETMNEINLMKEEINDLKERIRIAKKEGRFVE